MVAAYIIQTRNEELIKSFQSLLCDAGTRTWLQENWHMWADGRGENCIRYGLLSGFLFEAVIQFTQYKQTNQRLPIQQAVHSLITNLAYCGFDIEKDAVYIRQLDEIFMESGIKW